MKKESFLKHERVVLAATTNSANTLSLYPYQAKAVDTVLKMYKDNPSDRRAFLQMPTGTGKTRAAFQTCLLAGHHSIVWVAHQTDLVAQAYKEFMQDVVGVTVLQADVPPTMEIVHQGIMITFKTWQSFSKSKNPTDMLVIDECHCGSSSNSSERNVRAHISFKKIMRLAPTHLYISATPWALDKTLYPKMLNKRGNVRSSLLSVYTMDEAAAEGRICPVDICEVNTADAMELTRLECGSMEAVKFDSLEEGAEMITAREVNIKDLQSKKSLRRSTLHSAIDAYFTVEGKTGKLPPTIIFCRPNQKDEETLGLKNVMRTLKKKAGKHFGPKFSVGSKFVDSIGSTIEGSREKLEAFRNGEINVLCVVGMAREGFNYKQLEVAIDLCPAYLNERLMVQKVGRIMRVHNKKKNARYYVVNTFERFITHNGVKKEFNEEERRSMRDRIAAATSKSPSDVPVEDIDNALAGLARAGKLKQDISEGSDAQVSFLSTDEFKFSDESDEIDGEVENAVVAALKKNAPETKKRGVVNRYGFVITDASNSDPIKTMVVQSLFSSMVTVAGTPDSYGKKEGLRSSARAGLKTKPPGDSPLGRALRAYTSKSSGYYDPAFDQEIRSLAPQWFIDSAGVNKTTIRALALSGGTRPPWRTPLGSALSNYTRKSSDSYDPAFDQEIRSLAPQWFNKVKKK